MSEAIPAPSLVVLVGPPASGKSTWAAEQFAPEQVLCADTLRGVVGEHDLDLAATADAFEILDKMLEMRLGRSLTTVVDTTGLNADRRKSYIDAARRHGVHTVVVRFDTPADVCKARNRERLHPVPARAMTTMLKRFAEVGPAIEDEGWDLVLAPTPMRVVHKKLAQTTTENDETYLAPNLGFGLLISDFEQLGPASEIGATLATVAQRAEGAGFESLWLMDHLIQIPQVGREWDMMLEPYTTLAHIAAHTSEIRIGILVSPVTFRPAPVLAKLIATLDVLSGGRAIAGIGAGSSPAEHTALGVPFGSASERLDLLEQTAQALRTIWSPGAKSFNSERINIERGLGYPRPLQDPMPLIIGGSGEQRTLAIAARHGSGCNIFGGLEDIERRVGILHLHLERAGRSEDDFQITHLGQALIAESAAELRALVEQQRPSNVGPDRFAARSNAGTLDDHQSHFQAMASLGVDTAIVSTQRLLDPTTFTTWAKLISRFSEPDEPDEPDKSTT